MRRGKNIIVLLLLFVSCILRGQKPELYSVSRMDFSTGSFSDISPIIVKDGILFCSSRRFSTVKDRTGFDGTRLYNIYYTGKRDSSRWTAPVEVKSDRSTKFNNGPGCISSDGGTIYFTSEVETGPAANKRNFRNHNGIFYGQLSGREIKSITPFRYNSTQYNVGQPSISKDGKTLFFASDMPGGYGKSDIYYCELKNGEWSAPVNMGPRINSTGADNYPFIHPSGKLYFSSDRPGGMGRMDVYYTSIYKGKWEDPVDMPAPINSPADDFAFCAADNMQTGYFASNRQSDDDIFSFTSTIIRKSSCNEQEENSYCYRFTEENAIKYDSIPFRYEWRFGDGEKAEGPVADHCFSGPGKYIVQLDVTNLVTKEVVYNEKTDTLILTDAIQPYISGPDSIPAGKALTLDAAKTNLPGWNIAQYYWNFGDESVALGKQTNKSWTRPGTYNVQLIITSSPGADGKVNEACASKNIIVSGAP